MIDFPPEQIQQKGRLQPGRMFLVDTVEGRIVVDNEIKSKIARQKPYRRWLEQNRIELRGLFQPPEPRRDRPGDALPPAAGVRLHARRPADDPRARWRANGQEPVGSMGTDTPLAVLCDQPKLLFNYFKQLFAQVTNPPIDPLREGLVMSLMTFTGKQRNLLDETPEHCRQLKLPHPILTNEDIQRLRNCDREDFRVRDRRRPVRRQDRQPRRGAAARARRAGRRRRARPIARRARSLLIVSDRGRPPSRPPSPACWPPRRCTTGCWTRQLRARGGIVVESGEPREVMHFCLLCGYGANAINPYLAFEAHRGASPATATCRPDVDLGPAERTNYITAVKKGILKTMSKMGISTLRSYHARPAVRGDRAQPATWWTSTSPAPPRGSRASGST